MFQANSNLIAARFVVVLVVMATMAFFDVLAEETYLLTELVEAYDITRKRVVIDSKMRPALK